MSSTGKSEIHFYLQFISNTVPWYILIMLCAATLFKHNHCQPSHEAASGDNTGGGESSDNQSHWFHMFLLAVYFSTSKDCGGYKQLTLSYLSWFELLQYLKEMCLQVSIQCKSWTSHELRQEQCTNWWSMWIRCWLIYLKRFRNLSVVSM